MVYEDLIFGDMKGDVYNSDTIYRYNPKTKKMEEYDKDDEKPDTYYYELETICNEDEGL